MIRLVAGRCPTGRALAFQVEPSISVEVSPALAASIPNAEPRLTLEDLSEAFAIAFPERITVRKIQDNVARFYGINPDTMRQPRKLGSAEKQLVRPRQTAMYLARELTQCSLPDIGRRFGGRDHTTVLHALKAVKKRVEDDPYFELELEVLREAVAL